MLRIFCSNFKGFLVDSAAASATADQRHEVDADDADVVVTPKRLLDRPLRGDTKADVSVQEAANKRSTFRAAEIIMLFFAFFLLPTFFFFEKSEKKCENDFFAVPAFWLAMSTPSVVDSIFCALSLTEWLVGKVSHPPCGTNAKAGNDHVCCGWMNRRSVSLSIPYCSDSTKLMVTFWCRYKNRFSVMGEERQRFRPQK